MHRFRRAYTIMCGDVFDDDGDVGEVPIMDDSTEARLVEWFRVHGMERIPAGFASYALAYCLTDPGFREKVGTFGVECVQRFVDTAVNEIRD